MERITKGLMLSLLAITLTGCNLNINVFGEGRVISDSGKVDCADDCVYRGDSSKRTETLRAEPADGYEFLGFIGDCQSDESCEASYGFYVTYYGNVCDNNSSGSTAESEGSVSPSLSGCFPRLGAHSYNTDAIFIETEGYLDKAVSRSNACILTIDGEMECWGVSKNIPDHVTGVSEMALSANYTCAIFDGGIDCWGMSSEVVEGAQDLPELENPHSLRAEWYYACVIDNEEEICWGEI